MKQITNASASPARGSEKFLLLFVVVVGIVGLLLTFRSTPKDQHLDIEGIQLESGVVSPEAPPRDGQKDFVLR